ncbi:helix-turn-helix domain-containing protein [Roseomonas gilardii]|uniref:Helix-turn-helix domain-containing protein n=1 Tax=Roseomonas gilardii TaxID=257708 RepID=A0ABU3MKM0_9PROT|nr:helix-turn-helix domain-containing protein [Roseomonas gilardii]MDT8333361.1 helix-turn-helix domain-containing protein [Roseomonas gilardii]
MHASRSPEYEPYSVTVKQAREMTGLGNTTVYALIRDGRLKSVKLGKRTLILTDSIKALLAAAPPAYENGTARQPSYASRARTAPTLAQMLGDDAPRTGTR